MHPSVWLRAAIRRAFGDPHVLLGGALVLPVALANVIAADPRLPLLLVLSGSFLGGQVLLGTAARGLARGPQFRRWSIARLLVAVAYVAAANQLAGDAAVRPAAVLYVPVVVMAAASGRREMLVVGGATFLAYVAPVGLDPGHVLASVQRGTTLLATALILTVGTRLTVAALESTLARLRIALARDRRRSRQMAGIEVVGRALAEHGPTKAVLDEVMDLLVRQFRYRYVSVYLAAGSKLRLGAQRGYANPELEFDGTIGVTGRVMRTREAAFVPDARSDPDFRALEPGLAGEITVPLIAGGELLGVVNVESMVPGELGVRDLETIQLVAERLASALAISRQREDISTRAELFRRLAAFSATVNESLEADALFQAVTRSVSTVIPTDTVTLVVLDRPTGRYLVRGMSGADPRFLGVEIIVGNGLSGRAIRERTMVVAERFERARFAGPLRDADLPDVVTAVAIPLMRDDVAVGALTVIRHDLASPFSAAEREILEILGHQLALAVSNVFLHAEVTEASIRDALTGLFNRRHLDASIARISALRARTPAERRTPLSAILFDLDEFGAFNKRHGHRVGDTVLRVFADVLRERTRASDLAARYGGEEFVLVLEGADLDAATEVAEEIRRRMRESPIPGADGAALRATVSAGCATLPADESDLESLIQAADVGLALAKHSGRDRVVAV